MDAQQDIHEPTSTQPPAEHEELETGKASTSSAAESTTPAAASRISSSGDESNASPTHTNDASAPKSSVPTSVHTTDAVPPVKAPASPSRGFSFSSLALFRRQGSDKRAKASALVIRSLIVGPLAVSSTAPAANKGFSKPEMDKIKAQLLQPKTANKLIAQLRVLHTSESEMPSEGETSNSRSAGPIHAVCLDTTDMEAETRHFSRLVKANVGAEAAVGIPSVATASLGKLTGMLKDMHIVNLVTSPDFGLGQPGDGEGILSGALPTAETVINGIQLLTPQLMALGYATGKAIIPDHTGVYPPTDRMSVLTYWWGLELVLPSSSLHYLSTTQSVTHTMINFLTVLATLDSGVREILPFVRYIGQFVDFEFGAIQKQDRGQGVVCAATWIMPAAMVPRPWDFATPPPKPASVAAAPIDLASLPRPSQATDATSRPSESPSDMTRPMTPAPSLPPVLPEVVISSPNGTSNLI